jgi:probable F420-dependent oxidoreductase
MRSVRPNHSPRLTAGIHVPQAGPAASGSALRRAAVLAEQLGFADIWVSDHVLIPDGVAYPPSAYVFEALTTMTWVAAATERIRIGASVLVLPMRNPGVTAKSIASIDQLSGGRVIVGAAAGWLKAEFDAVGVPFDRRATLMDEGLQIMRTLWTEDHITTEFPEHRLTLKAIRAKPQPTHSIPIWIGGRSPQALRRAVAHGDAWHGDFISPTDARPIVEYLRSERPDPGFTISMRTHWDGLDDDHDSLLRELEAYVDVGVNHVLAEPRQRDADAYMRSIEALAQVFQRGGVQFAGQ